MPASVGYLSDWWLGGCRFNPGQVGNIFFVEIWSWSIFCCHSLCSVDSRRAVASFRQRMCTVLVNCLEDLSLPRKVWLGKLTTLDMTPLRWLSSKTSTQTNKSVQKYWYFSYMYFSQNICCGYSLEVPQWGASNEYPQHMFSWRNTKNIYLIPTLI